MGERSGQSVVYFLGCGAGPHLHLPGGYTACQVVTSDGTLWPVLADDRAPDLAPIRLGPSLDLDVPHEGPGPLPAIYRDVMAGPDGRSLYAARNNADAALRAGDRLDDIAQVAVRIVWEHQSSAPHGLFYRRLWRPQLVAAASVARELHAAGVDTPGVTPRDVVAVLDRGRSPCTALTAWRRPCRHFVAEPGDSCPSHKARAERARLRRLDQDDGR